MRKKSLGVKRCKVCDKMLHSKNQSMLCHYHWKLNYWKKRYDRNKTTRSETGQVARGSAE